jgi:hypothetical protein
MKTSKQIISAAAAIVCLALVSLARAEKIECKVGPSNAASEGFTVSVKPKESGLFRFTVTRDLSKAQWHGRDATLQVRQNGRLIATVPLNADKKSATKKVVYWFDIAQDRAAESHLTITEIQTAGGTEDGEKLLGGGTYYEFNLADFMTQRR